MSEPRTNTADDTVDYEQLQLWASELHEIFETCISIRDGHWLARALDLLALSDLELLDVDWENIEDKGPNIQDPKTHNFRLIRKVHKTGWDEKEKAINYFPVHTRILFIWATILDFLVSKNTKHGEQPRALENELSGSMYIKYIKFGAEEVLRGVTPFLLSDPYFYITYSYHFRSL